MRKKGIALILCLLLVFGWYIWEYFFRTYGKDHFDRAFEEAFDAEFIVNCYDALKDSGYFRCPEGGTMRFPEKVAIWPKDSDMNSRIQGIVEVNGIEYYDKGWRGNNIHWYTTKDLRSSYEDWEQDEKMAYKYKYSFLCLAPCGQIRLMVAANTRKECMEIGRRELLWLMSIAKDEITE